MTERDKRQGGRPFKPGGKKPFAGKPGGGKPPPRDKRPAPKAQQGERIAKAMARAGACSRRDAEEWIAAGRVAVNGRVLESPAFNVIASDRITIDGRPLAARERTRLFLFHKLRGLVTTDRDPEGRPTVFDYLGQQHPDLPRLMTVGRLDINTEGLLLMTNDGGLARTLELPQTGWLRRYRVRAHGATDQAALDALARGVTIDGVDYAPIEARLDRVQGANAWITLGLREGKNREVRRVLGSLGLEVNRLIRVSYGPFQLGELAEGAVEEVRTKVLRDQLGPTLIAQSLADFDTPAPESEERTPRETSDRAPRPRREERGGAERRDRAGASGRPLRPKRVERDEEPPKTLERPKPGSRKHVSTLRAERGKRLDKERVKIERGATADRKGRAVVVERVVAAAPKAAPETRNARRFKAERHGEPRRDATRSDGERPMRRKSTGEGRRFERRDGERQFENRAAPRRADRPGGERPFGDRRPDRKADGPRSPRPPRSRDADAPRARPRADRTDSGRAFEGRGPRQADKAAGERRTGRSDGERRDASFKPRGKPGGDRPRGPERKGPPRSGPPRGKR